MPIGPRIMPFGSGPPSMLPGAELPAGMLLLLLLMPALLGKGGAAGESVLLFFADGSPSASAKWVPAYRQASLACGQQLSSDTHCTQASTVARHTALLPGTAAAAATASDTAGSQANVSRGCCIPASKAAALPGLPRR